MRTILSGAVLPWKAYKALRRGIRGLLTDMYLVSQFWLWPTTFLMAFLSSNLLHCLLPLVCFFHITLRRKKLLNNSHFVKMAVRSLAKDLAGYTEPTTRVDVETPEDLESDKTISANLARILDNLTEKRQ